MNLNLYIGQKIKDFRKSSGMSQTQLAEILETTKQTISRYEKGDRKAGQDTLFALCDIFGVSIDDFFPPTQSPTPQTTLTAIQETVEKLEEPRRVIVLDTAKTQLEEQMQASNDVREETLYPYHIYEKLSAGTGTAIYEDHSFDLAYFNKELDHDIASWIYGDSMEPKYKDGQVALIKETGYDYDGAIYAVVWDGQTYIKKVYKEKDGLRLVSLNDKYDDKFARWEEEPRIIGKVVGNFMPMER